MTPSDSRLLWVTDLPTPYRVHQYRALGRELRARGGEFEVLFMARSSPWREWRLDEGGLGFDHRFPVGVHPWFHDYGFHLNPGIPWDVMRRNPTWLVVGGAWWMPSALLAIAAARLRGSGCRVIIGAEANPHSRVFPSGPVATLRRAILRRADGFYVPGRVAKDEIARACGSDRPFLFLPNVVDESRYGARAGALRAERALLRRRLGLAQSERVLLWPARLIEKYKGILLFLETIRSLVPEGVRILVAGEGPDRARIEGWLAGARMSSVRLLGQQTEEAMLELFAIADAVLLPSVSDANPLAVVEALWAGLPLLISDRCGNWPEAVDPGRNGWVVDPHDPEAVRAAFSKLASSTADELRRMGDESARIATERFSTPASVAAFVDALERELGPAQS